MKKTKVLIFFSVFFIKLTPISSCTVIEECHTEVQEQKTKFIRLGTITEPGFIEGAGTGKKRKIDRLVAESSHDLIDYERKDYILSRKRLLLTLNKAVTTPLESISEELVCFLVNNNFMGCVIDMSWGDVPADCKQNAVIGDESLEIILRIFPWISAVVLSDCPFITDAGFSHFKGQKFVEFIYDCHLMDTEVTNTAISYLSGITTLQGLTLKGDRLDESCTQFLSELINLKKFSCSFFLSEYGLKNISYLPIETLGFSYHYNSDKNLVLHELKNFKKLTQLVLFCFFDSAVNEKEIKNLQKYLIKEFPMVMITMEYPNPVPIPITFTEKNENGEAIVLQEMYRSMLVMRTSEPGQHFVKIN